MTIFPARHNGTTDGPYPVTSQANATLTAPAGMGTVSGVLDYFNGNYMLRITNRLMEFP